MIVTSGGGPGGAGSNTVVHVAEACAVRNHGWHELVGRIPPPDQLVPIVLEAQVVGVLVCKEEPARIPEEVEGACLVVPGKMRLAPDLVVHHQMHEVGRVTIPQRVDFVHPPVRPRRQVLDDVQCGDSALHVVDSRGVHQMQAQVHTAVRERQIRLRDEQVDQRPQCGDVAASMVR